MSKPDIHADDYALTLNTSKDMLECMRAGRLDSISIVPNMSCFEACMELFYGAIPGLPFFAASVGASGFCGGKKSGGERENAGFDKAGQRSDGAWLGRAFCGVLSAP